MSDEKKISLEIVDTVLSMFDVKKITEENAKLKEALKLRNDALKGFLLNLEKYGHLLPLDSNKMRELIDESLIPKDKTL